MLWLWQHPSAWRGAAGSLLKRVHLGRTGGDTLEKQKARPGFCLGGIDIGGWDSPARRLAPSLEALAIKCLSPELGGAGRGRPCRCTCSWACVFCCFDTSAIVGSSLQGNMRHPSHPPFALPEGEVGWVTPPPLLLRSLGHSVLPEASGTSLLAFPVVQLQSAVVSIS